MNRRKITTITYNKATKTIYWIVLGLVLPFFFQTRTWARSALDPLEDTFETLGETVGYGLNGVDAVNMVNLMEVGYGILIFIVWLKLAITPLLQGDITAPFVALVVSFFVFMSGSWVIGSFMPKETKNVSLFCRTPVVKNTPICKNVSKPIP